jgi:uncharacterized protein YajQ (UPF0234 family)
MPSFDAVSEPNLQEVRNAVDQANREIENRFDFKGSATRVAQGEGKLTIESADDYKVRQAVEILHLRLAKRGVDLGFLVQGEILPAAGGRARVEIDIRKGVDPENARSIVKLIKDSKLKVQASVQPDQVRITGKKKDDLQSAIALLRAAELDLPLQFTNFRD